MKQPTHKSNTLPQEATQSIVIVVEKGIIGTGMKTFPSNVLAVPEAF